MLKTFLHFALISIICFLNSAFSATSTSTFQVTAFVAAACTIASSTLAFSPPSYSDSSNLDATTTLTVTCTSSAPYSIAMGQGNNFSGGSNRLANSSNFLNYTLYQDAARTIAWTGSSGSAESGTGTGSSQTITVYGRIPSGQSSAPSGAYTDSVVATITY